MLFVYRILWYRYFAARCFRSAAQEKLASPAGEQGCSHPEQAGKHNARSTRDATKHNAKSTDRRAKHNAKSITPCESTMPNPAHPPDCGEHPACDPPPHG